MIRHGVDYRELEDSNGLPPGILYAVEMTESGGDPRAFNPRSGATGAFQFMPGTAKDEGVDPYDPRSSAIGAARYLGKLARKYKGDIDKTLAAFNWGLGNVDRKGMENMPEETRQYLPKVKSWLGPWADFDGESGQPQAAESAPWEDFPEAAQGRDPDVPPGAGEPGYTVTARDPDVPYAPQEAPAGADPDVPMPGQPHEYRARPQPAEDNTPLGMRLIPPAHRPLAESLVRGITDPVGAEYQNVSALLPDRMERAMFGGKTLAEIEAESEAGYRQRRDPSSIDWPRFTGQLVATAPLPAVVVRSGGGPLAALLHATQRGMLGATQIPTVGTEDDPMEHLRQKALQSGAGIASGLAGGAVGKAARVLPLGIGRAVTKYAGPTMARTSTGRGVIAGNLLSGTPDEKEQAAPAGGADAPWLDFQEDSPWEDF